MFEMSTTEGIDDGIGVSVLDSSVADADGKGTLWVIWGFEQETQITVTRHNRKVEIFFIIAFVLCDLPNYVLCGIILYNTLSAK